MRKQRNEAKRLGIGEGRDGEAQKFTQGRVLCENFAQRMCCANFAQGNIHPPKCKIVVLSNGKNSWFLRVGNAG